jgi:hypothetical protein
VRSLPHHPDWAEGERDRNDQTQHNTKQHQTPQRSHFETRLLFNVSLDFNVQV